MLKKLLYPLLVLLFLLAGFGSTVFFLAEKDQSVANEKMTPKSLNVELTEEETQLSGRIIDNTISYIDLITIEHSDEAPVICEEAEATKRMLVQMTEDDLYLFASIVECEAGDEPYDGMVGVAAVIINRIKSSKFPNTLSEVVYQPGQFSPVDSGILDMVMSRGPMEECKRAALDALYGANPVGDYLYFKMDLGNDTYGLSNYMKIGTTIFHDWE